jgi:hypothetical protein
MDLVFKISKMALDMKVGLKMTRRKVMASTFGQMVVCILATGMRESHMVSAPSKMAQIWAMARTCNMVFGSQVSE